MKERELADLLIQIGDSAGVDIERAAEELASLTFPSFVDTRAFRSSLLEAVEAHMRAQMEQRLQAMRQRLDLGASWAASPPRAAGATQPSSSPATPAGQTAPVAPPAPTPPAGEVGVLNTIVSEMIDDDQNTSDETIVWSPRRD